MTPEQRIKAKVKARDDAREIAEMLSWEDGTGHEYAESFIKELRNRLPVREAAKPKPPAKPTPIARLGATLLEFGKYADRDLDQTPVEYLDWLCRQQERLVGTLKEYLTHPELKSRRGHDV